MKRLNNVRGGGGGGGIRLNNDARKGK